MRAGTVDRGALRQNQQVVDHFAVHAHARKVADDDVGPAVGRGLERVLLRRVQTAEKPHLDLVGRPGDAPRRPPSCGRTAWPTRCRFRSRRTSSWPWGALLFSGCHAYARGTAGHTTRLSLAINVRRARFERRRSRGDLCALEDTRGGEGLSHVPCGVFRRVHQQPQHGGREPGPADATLVEKPGRIGGAQLLERAIDRGVGLGDERRQARRRLARRFLRREKRALRLVSASPRA